MFWIPMVLQQSILRIKWINLKSVSSPSARQGGWRINDERMKETEGNTSSGLDCEMIPDSANRLREVGATLRSFRHILLNPQKLWVLPTFPCLKLSPPFHSWLNMSIWEKGRLSQEQSSLWFVSTLNFLYKRLRNWNNVSYIALSYLNRLCLHFHFTLSAPHPEPLCQGHISEEVSCKVSPRHD